MSDKLKRKRGGQNSPRAARRSYSPVTTQETNHTQENHRQLRFVCPNKKHFHGRKQMTEIGKSGTGPEASPEEGRRVAKSPLFKGRFRGICSACLLKQTKRVLALLRASSAPPLPKSRLRITQESEGELKGDLCLRHYDFEFASDFDIRISYLSRQDLPIDIREPQKARPPSWQAGHVQPSFRKGPPRRWPARCPSFHNVKNATRSERPVLASFAFPRFRPFPVRISPSAFTWNLEIGPWSFLGV